MPEEKNNGQSDKTQKSVVACRFCGQVFVDEGKKEAMDLLKKHAYSAYPCRGEALRAAKIATQQLDEKYGGYQGAYKAYLKSLQE